MLSEALLSEPLKLPSVETFWCGSPSSLSHVLAHFDQMVMRPTGGTERSIIVARLDNAAAADLRARVAEQSRWTGRTAGRDPTVCGRPSVWLSGHAGWVGQDSAAGPADPPGGDPDRGQGRLDLLWRDAGRRSGRDAVGPRPSAPGGCAIERDFLATCAGGSVLAGPVHRTRRFRPGTGWTSRGSAAWTPTS